jgi:hypothetical protein
MINTGALVEIPVVSAFLLIQGGKMVDICHDPAKLNFELLDESSDWQVYAAGRNEFGHKEVFGYVARVWCAKAFSKYTVQIKGRKESSYTVTATTLPSELVSSELKAMRRCGWLTDPCNLSQICLFAC